MSSSALIDVKSTQAYTLEFVGGTADPCFTKGLLEASPSVYHSGNSFLFNYSQTKVATDLRFLKMFFDGLSVGNTFNFTSGTYVDIDTGAQTTWNGQFQLQGKTGFFNEYIYCSGVSGTTSLTENNYDANLFTAPIQFTAVVGATANILILKNPGPDPLNFSYLGLYGSDFNFEEYVQVDKSISNQYRIPVKNSIKLSDDSEVIYFSPSSTIVNENLFFQKSMVYVYLRGSLTPAQVNFDETINGILRITADSPGVFSFNLDKQNFQQSVLKTYSGYSDPLYYYWYPNLSLNSFVTNNVMPYTNESYQFATIYHLVYNTVTQTVYTSSALNDIPVVASTETYNVVLVNDNQVESLVFSTASTALPKNFKIDLSDARNVGTDIDVYSDAACSIPFESNSRLIGTPGTDGAAFLYYGGRQDLVQTIYMRFERENVKVLEIIID